MCDGSGFGDGSFGTPRRFHCTASIGSYRGRSCFARKGVFSFSRYFGTRFGSVSIFEPVAP